jgi:hypothetical protein
MSLHSNAIVEDRFGLVDIAAFFVILEDRFDPNETYNTNYCP